ncbi:head-tail connector protein [Devosia sp. SL43]|uniref:head-tail connector protein n=1 Tax=Devosia sp. SL43 TaxID=2806348 RepID=UPI001EFF7532|nr:head-tail connector protein [Devosia sp. SL43]UJW85761.1 phage gp6-like head-tail connector protein [Devosia sp. SL43]
MTALLDLKAQLNIIDTNEADDDLLTGMVGDALDHTGRAIGAEAQLSYDELPGGLRRAVLMLAAHFYENREAVLVGINASELPLGFWDLISPHRKWVF